MNVLDALNLVQLLNAVKGTEMEGQVIDLMHENFKYTHEHESNQDSEKLKFNQYFQNQKEGNHSKTPELTRDLTPYTIAEVRKRIELKQKESYPVTINDLQIEVKNLKQEIRMLSHENTLLQDQINNLVSRVSMIEKSGNIASTSGSGSGNQSDVQYLQYMEMITSQKWLIKITLLINREFKRELIALVDSGADLNCVQ